MATSKSGRTPPVARRARSRDRSPGAQRDGEQDGQAVRASRRQPGPSSGPRCRRSRAGPRSRSAPSPRWHWRPTWPARSATSWRPASPHCSAMAHSSSPLAFPRDRWTHALAPSRRRERGAAPGRTRRVLHRARRRRSAPPGRRRARSSRTPVDALRDAGGYLGAVIGVPLHGIGTAGAAIVLVAVLAFGWLLASGLSIQRVGELIASAFTKLARGDPGRVQGGRPRPQDASRTSGRRTRRPGSAGAPPRRRRRRRAVEPEPEPEPRAGTGAGAGIDGAGPWSRTGRPPPSPTEVVAVEEERRPDGDRPDGARRLGRCRREMLKRSTSKQMDHRRRRAGRRGARSDDARVRRRRASSSA